MGVFGRDDSFFNDQFSEDDDEIAERQRLARIKTRCPICGRNPKLGYPHAPDCTAITQDKRDAS